MKITIPIDRIDREDDARTFTSRGGKWDGMPGLPVGYPYNMELSYRDYWRPMYGYYMYRYYESGFRIVKSQK